VGIGIPQNADKELVDACKSGDQQAFRVLYEQHVGRVYALCVRLCGDRDEAADIAQDVFVQVWEKLDSFRGDSAFSTWLHRVATNIALSHIRKRKSWWQRLVPSEEVALCEAGAPMDIVDDALDHAIAKLPEQARLVFVLFAVEGYRHEEIGRLLGIAVGTSKAQYFRARALLKEQLEDER